MEHTDVCGAVINPKAPTGTKFCSYTNFVNWLVMMGCFNTPSGPPAVKVVTNL